MRKKTAAALVMTGATALTLLSGPGAHASVPTHAQTAFSAQRHGLGLDVVAVRAHEQSVRHLGTRTLGSPRAVRSIQAVPSSYSLQQFALSPGDQGNVGACVAWATGYSAYGLLMKEQGISGAPMAPMYIYAQIAKGNDRGTLASVALPMEQQQGIDTKSDYYQGDFDYTTQPTQAERQNASHYKLSGFTDLTNSGDRQAAIERSISSGLPVALGFQVRQSFRNLNSVNYNYNPSASWLNPYIGGHEVTIVGYDAQGVTIENSWGTGWGNHGYFTAPWSFIKGSDVMELNSVGKLVPTN